MTYKKWERAFKRVLKPLSANERERSVEYYRELFADKRADGISEEEILAEFGSPEACAYRILAESAEMDKDKTGFTAASKPAGSQTSIAEGVGLLFLTLILILPLACAALGIIVAFASVSVSGVAVAIAGIVFAIVSPFTAVLGMSALASVGIGLAMIGVGALLFAAFFVLTKYTALAVWNGLKSIYVRR